jgi:diphosphomevalonate decarboxylase
VKDNKLNDIANGSLIINSRNNFPTAAGCASSASSMSCLVKVLSKVFDNKLCEDNITLSSLARLGSGSACRSLHGGFVEWHKFHDNYKDSIATSIVDESYWEDICLLLLIVSDKTKETSSTEGMKLSKETSEFLNYRVQNILPKRLNLMREAILNKNFDLLCELTIKDSNNFHSVCRDTYPTICYMNDTSNFIVTCVEKLNSLYKKFICCYTFDAGPNAFIICEKENVELVKFYFNSIFFEIESSNMTINLTEDLQNLIKQLKNLRNENTLKNIQKFTIGKGAEIISFEN